MSFVQIKLHFDYDRLKQLLLQDCLTTKLARSRKRRRRGARKERSQAEAVGGRVLRLVVLRLGTFTCHFSRPKQPFSTQPHAHQILLHRVPALQLRQLLCLTKEQINRNLMRYQ